MGEVFLLLLFCSVGLQPVANERIVDRHQHRGRIVDLTEFFHRQHIAHRIHAAAAVFWIDHHTEETEFAEFFNLFGGKLHIAVAFDHAGQEFGLGEFAGGIAHGQLFFG